MKKLSVTCLLLVLLSFSVFAQLNSPDLQVLAIVKYKGTDTITLGTLKNTAKNYGNLPLEKKKELLNTMIDDRLLSQAAEKEGFVANDSQANQFFQQQLSQFARQPITEQQFSEVLQKQQGITLDQYMKMQTGMSVAEYKKQLKRQIAQNQYIGSKKQDELRKNSTVSHEEILSYYNNNRAAFVQPEAVEMFHVIVPKGSDEAAAKKYADELLSQLMNGKLSQEGMISTTEANAKAGKTDVKYAAQSITVYRMPEYMQQIGMKQAEFDGLYDNPANLKKYSKVEEVGDSFRFYYPIEKTETKFLGINDVVQKGTTATVYKYIENMLGMQKQQAAIVAARAELAKSLRDESSVQLVKTGADLDALLANW
ncbi:MAG: hypothetical protein K5839_03925 [Treponemataceae bacterium]|nr:hypothetical protein [Treponemataceae bacterium]